MFQRIFLFCFVFYHIKMCMLNSCANRFDVSMKRCMAHYIVCVCLWYL